MVELPGMSTRLGPTEGKERLFFIIQIRASNILKTHQKTRFQREMNTKTWETCQSEGRPSDVRGTTDLMEFVNFRTYSFNRSILL